MAPQANLILTIAVLSVCMQKYMGLEITVPGMSKSIVLDNSGLGMTNNNDEVTFGNANCTACTDQQTNRLPTFMNYLKLLNLTEIANGILPMCNNYQFFGIPNLTLYSDACLTKVPNKINVTDTKSYYQWEKVTMTSDCEIKTSVVEVLNEIQDLSGCPGITTVDGNSIFGDVKQVVSNIIPQIEKCYAELDVGIPTSLSITLTAEWTLPIGKIIVEKDKNVKGLGSVKVKAAELFNHSSTQYKESCESKSPTIDNCKCLAETKTLSILAEQIIIALGKCVIHSNDNKIKSTADSFLVCDK